MEFRPSFHKTHLPPGQSARNDVYRINSEYGSIILIVRMEMRRVVGSTHFCIHADNDPKEPA